MNIAGHEIGRKPFIIAEASINHDGNLDRALEMIEIARDAGCTAIKYQTYRTEEFCRPDDAMFDTFKRCELPPPAWRFLKEACDIFGIILLSTPQNPSDLEILLKVGMPAIKVGSDNFCNLSLLKEYAKHGLPMLLSTGMSDHAELHEVVLQTVGIERVFMICTSQYPAPIDEVNIRRIDSLIQYIGLQWIGFSDHTHKESDTASVMAVALGACVFERHFTLSRDLPGPEHAWACEPHDLRRWVRSIREAWQMRGRGLFELSALEREQKRKYQRRAGEMLRGEA